VERRQPVAGTLALVVAGLLAVGVVVGLVSAARSGSWVVASSAFVLMTAALSQWAAVRARARGGRLTGAEVALLVVLGIAGLALCGLDFVTVDRQDRAFTVLFAAGLIAVVGRVLGSYRQPAGPAGPTS
jgi:hypothetical protein